MDARKVICLILFLSILSPVSADVVSLNAGGSGNVVLNTDKYLEGFFFGVPSAGIACGNSVIETGETCDDGNIVSGDGCSATCQTESSGDTGGDTGGGAGGGGGETPSTLIVNPTTLSVDVQVETTSEKEIINVTNSASAPTTIQVSQTDLPNRVILSYGGTDTILGNSSITIPAGGTIQLEVSFRGLTETGTFTGKIWIGSVAVNIALNVKTELILFDSNIVVLNDDYTVVQGGELETLVTLIPMGDPARLDVTMNFRIMDYKNRIFLTKSETVLSQKQVQLNRNFDTGSLTPGNYIVALELVYPGGVAPSSAHFIVIERTVPGIVGKIILFLIILILLIVIAIIIILIVRKLREKDDGQDVFSQQPGQYPGQGFS